MLICITCFHVQCITDANFKGLISYPAVLDRMQPVALTGFKDHVQKMHSERDKDFEAEYQVFDQSSLRAFIDPHWKVLRS